MFQDYPLYVNLRDTSPGFATLCYYPANLLSFFSTLHVILYPWYFFLSQFDIKFVPCGCVGGGRGGGLVVQI